FLFKAALLLNDRFHTDFRRVPFTGTEAEAYQEEQNFGVIFATVNYLSMIFFCLGTMLVCGWRIQRSISTNKMSERVRKLHRQALRLLVLQTVNPLVFAVFPAIVPVFYIQSGRDYPVLFSWANAYLLTLFPLLNPIIFVICTKQYRNWILNFLLRHSQISSMENLQFSVGPSLTVTHPAKMMVLILPGFETINTFAILCDTLAILLNIGLIMMLQRQATSLDKKTVKFAIAFAVLSIFFAFFHALIQPFNLIFDGISAAFAASFMHDNPLTMKLMTYGMSPTYMALLECCAFNFLYKYAATCNKSLYHRFDSPIFVGSLGAVAGTWLVLYTYFGAFFAPTAALRNKERAQGFGPMVAMINFMSLILCCLGTMLWCGWKIQHMIKTNKMSERARKLHRQALRLLVLQ
ncbi:hypothetical protein PENTCL1PPCAC_12282, partial [Pristionchus entomophagus]